MHYFKKFYRALTRRERQVFAGASLGVLIALFGLGLNFYIRHTVSVPADGGTYREGIVGQPATVNPVVAKSAADRALTTLLFANITDLADSVETSDNGRTVKVHLKDNLRWSDGEEITSDDVIFTVSMIQNPDTASPLLPAWQGVTPKRSSKLEVDFSLPTSYAFFDENLENLRPLPKHLFASIPPANWKLSEYNTRPVASGPYVFVSRSVGTDGFVSLYRLRANTTFSPMAHIATFEIAFFKNRDDQIASFNNGGIDGFFAADASSLAAVRRPYEGTAFKTPTYYAVFWNQSASTALAQKEIRKALLLSVSTTELTAAVLGDYASPATNPFSPTFIPVMSASGTASSSVDAAKDLLQKNDWTLGDDGVLTKKIGKSTIRAEFTLLTPDVPFLVKTAGLLRDAWERIGVRATIQSVPLDELLAGPIKNRTYEALLFGNTLTKNGDSFSFWHSSERLYPGLNLALYQNTAADHLIEKIRMEQDTAKRTAEMSDLSDTILKDNPALFLFSPQSTYVTSKTIRGIESQTISDAADRLQNVEGWYVTTKRVKK